MSYLKCSNALTTLSNSDSPVARILFCYVQIITWKLNEAYSTVFFLIRSCFQSGVANSSYYQALSAECWGGYDNFSFFF